RAAGVRQLPAAARVPEALAGRDPGAVARPAGAQAREPQRRCGTGRAEDDPAHGEAMKLPPRKRLLLCLAGLALAASMVIGRERPADAVTAPAEPAARIDTRLRAEEAELDLSRLSREKTET